MLVTHDRYMLDRISTVVLGFDGRGGTGRFANYLQWEGWQSAQGPQAIIDATVAIQRRHGTVDNRQPAVVKKKLSYIEAREFAAIEVKIATAEQELRAKRSALEDPLILSDAPRLQSICAELEEIENNVDKLYARWAELEQKQS